MSNNVDQTTQMLIFLLIGLSIIAFVLFVVYVMLNLKDKKNKKKKSDYEPSNGTSPKKSTDETKQSVFDFMEFDKVEDNMIIQKNGTRYVMAIECQGVNYDLMSGIEKTGVEEGFVQFLNTLRHPIQLYIQTRTINLESSIEGYKKKVKDIEADLFKMKQQYNEMVNSNAYTEQQKNRLFFEITKQTNLFEYGRDIIHDTQKMSFNKNILNKKYYIIIAYHSEELGKNEYDKNETQSMAFSELYTRAQSIIRAISSCGVNGKVLNSIELSELLYVSYNRDESEVFDLKKAIRAEYDRLYSTAPDVIDRRIKELDRVIEERAVNKITEKVEKIRSRNSRQLEEKEASIEELADEMAKFILSENTEYLGVDVVDEIVKELDKEIKKKEEEKNEKKETRKTGTRRTTKTS